MTEMALEEFNLFLKMGKKISVQPESSTQYDGNGSPIYLW